MTTRLVRLNWLLSWCEWIRIRRRLVRGVAVTVRRTVSADQALVTVSWHRDVTLRCWCISEQGEWAWHRRALERGQSARRRALVTRINCTTACPPGLTGVAHTCTTGSQSPRRHSGRKSPSETDRRDTISWGGEAQWGDRHNCSRGDRLTPLADTVTCVFCGRVGGVSDSSALVVGPTVVQTHCDTLSC